MGMVYRTREGPLSATVNVWAVLATQGSVASPGQLLVPNGKTKIKQLAVSIGDEAATAATGGCTFMVRLSGGGLKYGEQILCVGGRTRSFTTDGTNQGADVFRYDVDLDVVAGAPITIEGAAGAGATNSTYSLGVTLGFA